MSLRAETVENINFILFQKYYYAIWEWLFHALIIIITRFGDYNFIWFSLFHALMI